MSKLSFAKLFVVYWVCSLVLYAFGPFDWETYHPVLFWSLNVAYILAFIFGWCGSRHVSTGDSGKWTELENAFLLRRIGPMLHINLIYQIVNLFRTMHLPSFDIRALLASIQYALVNRAEAYGVFQANIHADSTGVAGGFCVTLLNYVWEIWAYTTFLLGIILYKQLKFHQKLIVTATVLLELISYLATGTRIGVFRVVLVFLLLYYLNYLRKVRQGHGGGMKGLKFLGAGIVFLGVLSYLFMHIRGGRDVATSLSDIEEYFYSKKGLSFDPDCIFFKLLPESLYWTFTQISSYYTQGYYGMSIALQLPFIPMWGIGFSMALWNMLSNFSSGIADVSYQMRGEQFFHWGGYGNWHSMYTWFANDLSFYGVVFVMLLFGFFFQKAVRDAVELDNPYAKVMVYLFFLMAVFVPCNNQLAQQLPVLMAFIYSFIHWQLSKRHFLII